VPTECTACMPPSCRPSPLPSSMTYLPSCHPPDTTDAEMPAVSWVQGDAESLPIASGSIDLFTIAFGIRNVTHVDAALREAHRVLRPGGRFMCLEFSHVATPGLQQAYDAVSGGAGRGGACDELAHSEYLGRNGVAAPPSAGVVRTLSIHQHASPLPAPWYTVLSYSRPCSTPSMSSLFWGSSSPTTAPHTSTSWRASDASRRRSALRA